MIGLMKLPLEKLLGFTIMIDEKEMSVCESIVYMIWDLDGLRPMDELIHRLTHPGTLESHVFSTEAEVLNTIAILKEKRIIFDEFTTWTIEYKGKKVSRPKKNNRFCN